MNRFHRLAGVCALLVILNSLAWAHDPESVERAANAAYQNGEFLRSGRLFVTTAGMGARPPSAYYNAACAYALAGVPDSAMTMVQLAVQSGFADIDLLRSDDDLEVIRLNPSWASTVAACSTLAASNERKWNHPAWKTDYVPDISLVEKVAGLSRVWATAKYGFAYFDQVPQVAWDALYFETLEAVMASASTLEYYRILERMVARLQDGHTYVVPSRELRPQLWGLPLIEPRLVEDRVLVVHVWDDDSDIAVGDEIVRIDGNDVVRYAEDRIRPYQFASTPQDLATKMYGRRLLAGPEGREVSLDLRRPDGRLYNVRLKRLYGEDRSRHIPTPEPLAWKLLPDGIAYVQLNTFNTDETAERFEAALDTLARAKALIIDIRENGGGNSGVGWRILQRLTDRPFETSRWDTPEYRPVFRAWGWSQGWYGSGPGVHQGSKDAYFKGTVAVLTSARTYSAAEDFCVAFRAMDRGVIVGEATGGSTGQPLRVPLPGGCSLAVCSKRDRFPDGTSFVGLGIQPDVVVAPTLADVRSGRDAVLERAIEIVMGNERRF